MTVITAATPAPPRARRVASRQQWIGLLYVAPAVALVVVFFLIPLGMTAWMSLHNWPLMGEHSFIGLGNYVAILRDTRFWNALRFTAFYTVIVTIAIFVVAFPLALFVERPRPLTNLYRTMFFMPAVVGFASASLLWSWLLNVDSGLFSPAAYDLGLIDRKFNLLATFQPAFWSIIAMVVWKVAGFTMIILMAGLQSIPQDLQEAAVIDGAGPFARFRAITLPLMRRTLALALILSVAGSILAFDQFYIILRGGPRNQTLTAVYWIFNQSFVSFKLGYGAALSMVLLVILVALSLVQLWLLRKPEGLD
ncbi:MULTISPECIES: sugar ABC transporter permease [unclassified Mesorhizobium]|uniref:carbohydrate ABC transporter permease n=1 Tax=unclassified Mesorhizobium TaxID=325217 RepID=UPI000FC99D59|nr:MULTISPECIES: sugar ABC transporter permease [unclassified Mesorhizobium]RUU53377.1 sugar ABC transporter permease [Mesorhizobium sp. M7A.T.Ca.TU.009.01.1.1]RUU72144.1 sugar ABC transporter permease [Mesorhizobium sp. M7A.T.Ca.TU.009.01.1.2]AZV20879.1 sugar ABC transporter permease [Mesorhizobium sp. M7A.F.Ce.TU.012.03.2.1]RUT85348.1 sugar ABC transporter permease [Mesorhizobium sp. M7A.T.Ca.US.000.02.1.1]RUT86114.1 sugar ABC transporter permease [Mesorhizobium sp. M7A.T.Ca.US.000.02.2.1]